MLRPRSAPPSLTSRLAERNDAVAGELLPIPDAVAVVVSDERPIDEKAAIGRILDDDAVASIVRDRCVGDEDRARRLIQMYAVARASFHAQTVHNRRHALDVERRRHVLRVAVVAAVKNVDKLETRI